MYTYCLNNPIILVDPSGHSGETATAAGSMWWLCAADGPIPAGDVAYGVIVGGTAVYEYGPAVVNWVGTYGSAAWDTTVNFAKVAKDKVSKGSKKAWDWVKNKFGGSGNQDPNKMKPKSVNLPSWKKVSLDMEHILSGHTAGGSRASNIKDLFPSNMNNTQIKNAILNAYRYSEKIFTQGDRVLVRGTSGKLQIEMWVNTATKTIETAYPIFK